VWEPILPTDFSKPISIVLNRISDARVTQFWDEQHVLATRMAKDAREPQPVQTCCVRNNHLWDLVAVYGPGVTWDDVMPTAVVFNGPVLYVRDDIVKGIATR
jgi:hypothetical protein